MRKDRIVLPAGGPLPTVRAVAVGAHPDDLEIMCWHGIGSGSFCGVVVADGAGSPRSGPFAAHGDERMRQVRLAEQRRAAQLGEYAALVCLGYESEAVKRVGNREVATDLTEVLRATRPDVVYTHNPFDAHDTHVAVAAHVLRAVRGLAADERPRRLLGCEVWRSLDWLDPADKQLLDVSAGAESMPKLIAVHASQVAGGKRYDLAAAGRRRANATFNDPRAVDQASHVEVALDLTPLVDGDVDVWAGAVLERFNSDVLGRLRRYWSG